MHSFIFCKTLMFTVISNEKPNELAILSVGKIERVRHSKLSFLSNDFIANDSRIKIICSYTVVFSVLAVLYFRNSYHLLKHHP